jgi:tRNA (mo5U34)-methyltransferase
MKSAFIKSFIKRLPVARGHFNRVNDLVLERKKLAQQVESLAQQLRFQHANGSPMELQHEDWSQLRERKHKMSEAVRRVAASSVLVPKIEPSQDHLSSSVRNWIKHQVEAERYWFQKIEVFPGYYSPGWSDPMEDKLPYFGLPPDMTGMRVLDIGCAEGFFSFEAEKRGAREVIGIDSFPDSVRRFNIVKAARQSNATAFLMNVYDLEPKRLGTFDLVLFYGVFYHLKHPQLSLERIRSICTGSLLFQTHIYEEPAIRGTPWARFYPHGIMSGDDKQLFDPTVFWLFNSTCCLAMLDHVGFTDLRVISNDPQPFVVHARVPEPASGIPPDQTEAPWC